MQKLKKDFYALFAGRTDSYAFTVSPPFMGQIDEILEFHAKLMYGISRWKFICLPEFSVEDPKLPNQTKDRWHYHGVIRGPLYVIQDFFKTLCLISRVEKIKSPDKWFTYITKDLHKMRQLFMSIGYSPQMHLDPDSLIESIIRQDVGVGDPYSTDGAIPHPVGSPEEKKVEVNNLAVLDAATKDKIKKELEMLFN